MDTGMIMIQTPCWILMMSFNLVGIQITVLDNHRFKFDTDINTLLDFDDEFQPGRNAGHCIGQS